MKLKCLITENFHPALVEELTNFGIVCDTFFDITTIGVFDIIGDYDILIVNSKIDVNKNLIDRALNLKIIGRVGSGMEIIDIDYCKLKNIEVCSAPEGNCESVGEYALALLLNLMHCISKADISMRQGIWKREEFRGTTLRGKTIGIIGYGHTGKAFAQCLQGFGATILANDIQEVSNEFSFVKMASLNEILEKAHIISIHIPWNSQNHHFVNETFINQCKNNFILINTSRGAVCDTSALSAGLKSKKIMGLGLDVFENEKPSSWEDRSNEVFEWIENGENIVLTPHIAGWTHESKKKLAEIIAQKVIHFCKTRN